DAAGKYFEQVKLHPEREPDRAAIGPYLETVSLLGKRTGEMHLALAHEAPAAIGGFLTEPFSDPYRLSLYHSLLNLLTRSLDRIRQAPGQPREAELLLASADNVRSRLGYLRSNRIDAMRIRIHGAWHLGQLLYTGRDFIVTDIEGDQQARFDDRRKKRSPLRDVASMLLSFRRVAASVHTGGIPGVVEAPDDVELLDQWSEFWYSQVSAAFVAAWRETAAMSHLLPGLTPPGEQFDRLLEILQIEAALTAIDRPSIPERGPWRAPELRMILNPAVAAAGSAAHE